MNTLLIDHDAKKALVIMSLTELDAYNEILLSARSLAIATEQPVPSVQSVPPAPATKPQPAPRAPARIFGKAVHRGALKEAVLDALLSTPQTVKAITEKVTKSIKTSHHRVGICLASLAVAVPPKAVRAGTGLYKAAGLNVPSARRPIPSASERDPLDRARDQHARIHSEEQS